jgi:hypothetical protein
LQPWFVSQARQQVPGPDAQKRLPGKILYVRLTVMFTALIFIFIKLSHQPNKDAFRMPSQAKNAN